jgi:mRNA-degrading endonuclease RelE of RelBE toxin-antitoxin system
MKILYSPHFIRSYRKAPDAIQQAFDKQSLLLLKNLRHPSLHAKKDDESADLWQARVTGSWRFYFKIEGDRYRLEEIKAHPKK